MIAIMMGLTVVSVIMRYLFRKPILGAYEITELMMVVVIFCALAYTQVKKRHVSVDIMVSRLPIQIQCAIDSFVSLVGVGFFIVFTWRVYAYTEFIRLSGDTSVELGIPFFPFTLVIVISSGVLCLVLLVDLARSIATVARK
jgi:TRAP-type C4-dicarboxylate transport system permease small subunit